MPTRPQAAAAAWGLFMARSIAFRRGELMVGFLLFEERHAQAKTGFARF